MAATRSSLIHFLLVYSYDDGALIRQREFKDSREATRAYEDAEQEFRGALNKFEVVLLGADSLDTIMQTHGHYFRSTDDSLFSDFLTSSAATS
ncbi:hypothetical protein [Terrabacter sp. NPDC000476]|uniref:hypothetical protein n=1 Tax=Terrabacter sp. NPDC000476 TaxID=3154258 RepID=UPI003331FAE5